MEGAVALVVIGLVAGIGLIVVAQHNKYRQKIAQTLAAIAQRLDGKSDRETLRAWGMIADTDVEFRLVTRGSGKHAQAWTEVAAELPAKYPLTIFVRKHGWRDAAKIDAGEMVDVHIGNEAFDARFLVEAAPADVARVLFDERACSYLLELEQEHWLEVATKREADKQVLRLDVRTWLFDNLIHAETAVEVIAAIAGRVREAYRVVELAAEATADGSPYRPMLEDKAARRAAEARIEEVARVEKVRTEREARERVFAITVLVLFLFGSLVLVAAMAGR